MMEIPCTPCRASGNDREIRRLEKLGVLLFRINRFHVDLFGLEWNIRFIRE